MKRATQAGVVLELLRSGPRFSGELEDAGVGRPNCRVADLRAKGYEISCEHVKVAGGTKYRYSLIFDAERDSAALPVPFQDDVGEALPPPSSGAAVAGSGRVLHVGSCPWWSDGPCDCMAGLALEEASAGPVGVSSSVPAPGESASQGARGTPGVGFGEGALDIRDQLQIGDDAELLALFGGGA